MLKLSDPTTCFIDPVSGKLAHATGRYEKRLADLAGLYRDEKAFDALAARESDRVVYAVEEFRPTEATGDLIFGVTHMEPGAVSGEYFMTRGHIHKLGNRPEIYQGLSGEGLMLMESPQGETRIVEIRPHAVCYVPPFWIHRSVNTGSGPFVMFFCYPSDSGQDYEIIARSGGMRSRIFADGKGGWVERENDLYRPRTSQEIDAVAQSAA
ncbi:MAG: glucose-6-phosphate isomerase [Rhizobiales bacterium]|nr:glucose-6-phosphate isomerase [Hyphomicrobiales bacterium]OJX98654.1 MAG: glucose-6-phosphate isomerase [Rhizobiales bacterium 63-22]